MLPAYQAACRANLLTLGRPLLWKNENGPDVVLFPTKHHWRDRSDISLISSGLAFYNKFIDVPAAFPLLGAGLGGLDQNDVLAVLDDMLDNRHEVWMPVERGNCNV